MHYVFFILNTVKSTLTRWVPIVVVFMKGFILKLKKNVVYIKTWKYLSEDLTTRIKAYNLEKTSNKVKAL